MPGDPNHPRRTAIRLEDGALIVGEINFMAPGDIRLGAGMWGYTSDFEPILPGADSKVGGNIGGYAFVDAPLYVEPHGEGQGLAAFLRVGFADENINQLGYYLGFGVAYTGLIPNRDEDQFGIAVAIAANGDPFMQSQQLALMPVDDEEIDIELTYRAPVASWLTLQPDVQYVINPGTVGNLDNALVFGLRFEIGAGL